MRVVVVSVALFATVAGAQEVPSPGPRSYDRHARAAVEAELPEPVPMDESTPEPADPVLDAGMPVEPPVEQAPAAEPPPSWTHLVEANGYVSARVGFSRSRVNGLIPTNDLPELAVLGELNAQVKVKYLEHSFVYGDLSLIVQTGGFFRGVDKDGNEVEVKDHNVPAIQPAISLNELYVLHEVVPAFNLLVGKKRLVWGSGQAYNPTDLLNIRKDPTDPTFQRAGAWMARAEVPLENFAFSAVFAPGVLKSVVGLPQQFLTWPDWDKKDDEAHYLMALRAYALLADADLNFMLFYSNLYGDSFKNKVRFGASFSRYFFTTYELHAELLLGSGSSRQYINRGCTSSGMAAYGCAMKSQPFITQSKLEDPLIYPKLLVGGRKQFGDDSVLSVEYLYQAEGYSVDEYQDQVNALDLIQQAKALGVPANQIPNLTATASSDGIPQRFTFDPVARHYAFLSFSKSQIFDDFTFQLVTIANLQDLSTLWSPSISWSATQWFTLSALGFIPFKGPNALAVRRPTGDKSVTEYGEFPIVYRGVLEARIFY